MGKKKDTQEEETEVVNRIHEPKKLSSRPWFWPVFVAFVIVLIGLIVLFSWLLAEHAKNTADNDQTAEAIRRLVIYVKEKINK